MSSSLASIIFAIGIAGLFYFDRDKRVRVSWALWMPSLWLFFCLSRPLSQWLGVNQMQSARASVYVEGSPIDRTVYIVLEIIALLIVFQRWSKVGVILRRNWALVLFFLYAGLSITWSGYPFVTLKHWIKGIGDVLMILIVLTEQDVPDALRSLFTRLAFVLVPLSVLYIKYYPHLGRFLNLSWTMEPVGVATQKNALGELCDYLGLVLLWRFRNTYNDREDTKRTRRLLALGAVMAMIIWLLWTCNSMTSICAVTMASIVMLLSTSPIFGRRPSRIHLLMAFLLAVVTYALFFQSSGDLIESLGRTPTLTGRTKIWRFVLSIPNSRLFGSGYESFWLGSRLRMGWYAFPNFHLQEAHNGYIELFLNLGWVGIILLALLIATSYRKIIAAYRRNPEINSLRISLLLAVLVNAMTEAAFRMMSPPWLALLVATIGAPAYFDLKSGTTSREGNRPWPAAATDIINRSAVTAKPARESGRSQID